MRAAGAKQTTRSRRRAAPPRHQAGAAAGGGRSRQRLAAAWAQLTGTGAGASIGLALLVSVCVFICVAAPRGSLHSRTGALQRLLARMPATERSIDATVRYGAFAASGKIQPSDLRAAGLDLAGNLAATRLPLAPAATRWSGLTTGFVPVTHAAPSAYAGPGSAPQLEILYRDALPRYGRLIAGRLPVADSPGSGGRIFQSAVTAATAARFGLHVGSRLALKNGVTLAVTGIIRPVSPGAAFWAADPTAAGPLTISSPLGAPYWTGAAFVGPAELTDLQGTALNLADVSLEWDFPLSLGGLTADQVATLQHELTAAVTGAGTLFNHANGNPFDVTIASGLATDLAGFVSADAAIGSLLSLLFVSLTLIGAVVVLLGARLLTSRRDGEFALMRARGAALRQLAGVALRGSAVVVLPAAIIAAAIALVLTPGAAAPLAWWLAGLTAVAALAGPPLMAVRRHAAAGRLAGSRRPETRSGRRAGARRLVAEAALILAAVGGLVLLRLQGLPAAGGTDLYLSAAPALVAVPVAVLVVRGYPVVLRALLRLAAGRRGVTGYVGLARSARTSLTAVLPAFALVLALAVIAFGALVRAAVLRGEVAASWQSTGADAVVGSAGSGVSLPPSAQRAIAGVPGVEHTATILETAGSVGPPGYDTPVNIAVLDPVRYAAVLADTPVPPFPAAKLARPPGGPQATVVPVLASPAAAILLRSGPVATVGIHTVRVRVAGLISSTPAMPIPGPFLVFPQWAEGPYQLPPNVMFLAGPRLDARALKATAQRTAPDVVVTLQSAVLAGLRDSPLAYAGYVAFAGGAAAAAGFSVLILLLTLVLGARSRELTLARLATMGLSPGQARGLAAIETLPPVLAATVGGIACAGALAPLIGPELDLSAFTGYGLSVPIRADLGALALTAAGLVILTLATLAVQAVAASRRGLGRALRVGE